MKLSTPQNYELHLIDDGPYRLSTGGAICRFSKPASVSRHPKLYTVTADDKLIYVGVASQSMSSRLALGFRANGRGGYHGYKWKNLRRGFVLSVWTAEYQGGTATIRDLETIEAEVAFLCRQESGQWPQFQHEIHFYPSLMIHREAAKKIYAHAIQEKF